MTQDVYLGRRAADGSIIVALEDLVRRRDLDERPGLFPPLSESG